MKNPPNIILDEKDLPNYITTDNNGRYFCGVCSRGYTSRLDVIKLHLGSIKHKKKLENENRIGIGENESNTEVNNIRTAQINYVKHDVGISLSEMIHQERKENDGPLSRIGTEAELKGENRGKVKLI